MSFTHFRTEIRFTVVCEFISIDIETVLTKNKIVRNVNYDLSMICSQHFGREKFVGPESGVTSGGLE